MHAQPTKYNWSTSSAPPPAHLLPEDALLVGADSRSGIEQDPNLPEDPEYIIRLIGKVLTVSLETVKLCESLTGGEDEPWRKHGLGPGAP